MAARRADGTRTYGEYCGVARALDLVGDRWTLLMVRELLVGPARYAELHARLPGIATNLLVDRLRDLEARGLVARDDAAWGATYSLTARGAALEEVLAALVRWSTPLMATGRGDDEFRASWLVVALRALLAPRADVRATVELVVDGDALTVTTADGAVAVTLGSAPAPDATLEAPAELVLALASGSLALDAVTARPEVAVRGSHVALRRVLASTSR